MRMNRLIVVAAAGLAGTVACHRSTQDSDASPASRPAPWLAIDQVRPNSIVGKVVNDSGSPVTGLQIILDGKRATTDSAGRFEYLDVPAGWHTIDVERSGSERVHEIEKTVDGSGLAIAIQLRARTARTERLVEFCTTELRMNVGVVVHPVRLPLTSMLGIPRGIAIRVVDGSYDDTIYGDSSTRETNGDLRVSSGGQRERPGDYTVEVTAPGFRPWRRTGIHVAQGKCHITSQSVEVTLEPMTTKHE